MKRFQGVGVIRNQPIYDQIKLDRFYSRVNILREEGVWDKEAIVSLFFDLLPDFAHKETGKYLDQRM